MDRLLTILIQLYILRARLSRTLSRLGIGSCESWQPGQKLKLLIVGYNGARNTGADARVAAAVKQIRELFGPDRVQISVITLNEELLEGYFDEDVRLLKISSIYPADLYRACCTHHAAVLCEGSTLKSTFANALSLFFCEACGIMAAQKKPCIAFGSEAGHMEGFLEKFVQRTCRNAYFISRTQESQEVLTRLGIEGHVGTDTAWLYDDASRRAEAEQLLRDQGWDGKAPLLGIAAINPYCWPVRASARKWIRALLTGNHEGQYDKWYFYSDSPQRRNAYQNYIDEIASAAGRFCEAQGFFPVLLGMERMDEGPCRDLSERLDRPCAVFLSGEHPARSMTGILRILSSLITSRYHAAVLSMEGGCPITAVSMDERLDSLMRELSFDRRYLHHTGDEDLGQKLLDSLEDGAAHRAELQPYLIARARQYAAKQEEMGVFLKEYIEDHLK